MKAAKKSMRDTTRDTVMDTTTTGTITDSVATVMGITVTGTAMEVDMVVDACNNRDVSAVTYGHRHTPAMFPMVA